METSLMQEDLRQLDKRVYDMETGYLTADYSQCGSVFKGFEGFLSSKDNLRKVGLSWRDLVSTPQDLRGFSYEQFSCLAESADSETRREGFFPVQLDKPCTCRA